jgi:hypothetical protein
MATRPATAPVRRPTNLGFFSNFQAMKSQQTAAMEAQMSVLMKAVMVTLSTFSSLPALKPYQPNHSRPVPRATSGMLWGPLVGDLALAHVEHRGQGGEARRGVDSRAAREVEHAPGGEQPAAPDHVGDGEVDEDQPSVRKTR